MSESTADNEKREIVDYSDRMSDNDDSSDDDIKQSREDSDARIDSLTLPVHRMTQY